MTEIHAYLTFNGNCREAMIFYQKCLGGRLSMQTIKGSPVQDQCSPSMQQHILHAILEKNDLILMGSDMIGPDGFVKGNTVTLSLACSSRQEINSVFSTLSAGGNIIHPLKSEVKNTVFGILSDKFGIRWMLNYDRNIETKTNRTYENAG
jgi:PhnB protein